MFNFNFCIDKEHVYRDCIEVGNTGQHVVVDSRETPDHGYETMVFPADEDGEVLDWGELDVDTYRDWQEMKEGHDEMCKKWKEKEDMKSIYEE